jgi:single-stranded-DNA-specific exonuclease
MPVYKWNILERYDEKKDPAISILESRGVEDIEEFLHPPSLNDSFKSFSQEFKKSLKEGRDFTEEVLDKNMPLVIFGDYDSDGINATAILYNFFKYEKGYEKTFYFIPNRFEHSYGLSKEAVDDALKKIPEGEKALFITVDVGITAVEGVSYIKSLGHSIILTDHHQKPDEMPDPDVLIWDDTVCGSVISWVFSKALGSKSVESIANAAVATVTDLLPMVGFNRVVVKKGLEVMNTNPPAGLKKILQVSGIGDGEITTYELGWIIGPRLNAAGRLKDSEDSIKLLTEKDDSLLEEYAKNLDSRNIERQEKTLEMYDLASNIDENNLPKIIFSSNEEYHEGVIGLVSAKLTQKYYRPSVVISLEDGVGKGSVRSIPGINIIEILREFDDLFVDLGGHPMAGGFTIEKKNIPEMEKKVSEYISKKFDDEIFMPVLDIDLEVPGKFVDLEFLENIDKLKPFGMSNEQPVFLSRDMGVFNVDIIGKNKDHLKIKLFDGEKYHKAVFFGGAEYVGDFVVGEKVDIVYTLSKNEYNGNKYVDLIVKDFRKI